MNKQTQEEMRLILAEAHFSRLLRAIAGKTEEEIEKLTEQYWPNLEKALKKYNLL